MSQNTVARSTRLDIETDLRAGGFRVVIFEGKTSNASTLGGLEDTCSKAGGDFNVRGGSAGGYSFTCTAR